MALFNLFLCKVLKWLCGFLLNIRRRKCSRKMLVQQRARLPASVAGSSGRSGLNLNCQRHLGDTLVLCSVVVYSVVVYSVVVYSKVVYSEVVCSVVLCIVWWCIVWCCV